MTPPFDYQRFLIGRKRLGNVTFAGAALWWTTLLVVAIGSSWWAPMARFKNSLVWGGLTVDRILALGALVSVVAVIGGPWLVRNLHRPPQLFVLLRDFQSSAAAELAVRYVRRRGAKWGYWLTLENVDLRARDSVGGEVETEPDEARGKNESPPIGAWWATSLGLGLFTTTFLLLVSLDSAPLEWMRKTFADFGIIGDLALGVTAISGFCALWLATTLIIRSVLVRAQRAVVLPERIDSEPACRRALDTVVGRVRRRATPLTLGPLPVVSVDDRWWWDVVEHSIAEASLVVFVLTARESAALRREMDLVRKRFDPRRTLYVHLDGGDLRLTDGLGQPMPGTSSPPDEDRIDTAVRSMLVGAHENGADSVG